MKKITLLFLLSCAFFSRTAISQNIDIGDIPQDRIAISGWEDIQFDDSGNWTTVDVTTRGVVPNTGANMGPAIQQMIMSGNGKTIYEFPAGNFIINSTVQLNKSDFQIIGQGSSTKFLLRGGDNAPGIRVAGNNSGNLSLSAPIDRGDDRINVTSVSNVSVGDYLFIAQANGARTFDLDDQIVKILAINGNELRLDMKIGLPFLQSARVEKLNMRKNVKFSNFFIERLAAPNQKADKILFQLVFNGEISKIESKKELRSHVTLNNSRNVLVFDNNIYGNFGRDRSGGFQYGVTANRCTRVNIVNNRLTDLRHHIALQFGTDHSVIAYNRANVYNHYADYGQHNSKGCHNNLFEGNYGSELFDDNNQKAWGTPYVVWFRNHAKLKIGSEYGEQYSMAIIGNEIQAGSNGIKRGNSNRDNMAGANIVNIDGEGGNGNMLWEDLPNNATLPNSLYLTEKPDFLSKWPLYGPEGITVVNNCTADYEEQNGLVVIEAENRPAVGGWQERTTFSGFTGDGYFEWLGDDNFNNPGEGVISTTIQINDPGRYRFEWRSKVGEGDSPTESNDSWLKFPDASDFYGQQGNSIVYPKGSGQTPVAEGAGGDGYFKIYSSGTTDWTWSTRTSDNDAHNIFVEFDTPGVYTMLVSGRSRHHLIDRITLFKEGVNNRNLSLEETSCDATDNDTNQAPSVSFTSPTNNITLEEGYDDFVVVALPEDSDGTISTTSLFINDQFIRNENLAPYEWGNGNNVDETLNLGVGTHTFRVVATDNDGATAEDTFTLTVTAPNVVPTVTITTPSSDAITLEEGYDTLVVVADPSDSDGTIAEVALFIDGTFIRNEGVAPYEWGLGNNVTENLGLSVGVHTFRVVATDDEGATAEDTFELTVTASEGNDTTGEIEVSGELRKWHNVALTFTGPTTSETANNNPFLNYRLDVTFTHSSGSPSYVVPGYYAADGDAAQTSATSGNKWRVHFAPDEIGTWNYEVSFRQGNNVAVSNNSSAGSSAGFMDGATGSLEIAVSDKTGRDFRGKGRLQYVGEHYLKFAETGDYFIKQGPDSPENLFAYDDFDNTPNIGNRRKDFAPHLNDWQAGDPTWQNNKGRGLIGAINYIASEGLNSMSFLTMNIEGDDENVFPYIDSDDRLQMDVSKLGQWAIAVEYMQENGIFAHFKTQETENETLLDNGDLGRERRLYYRELIARFGYNLALNWNLGEENGTHGDINQTTEQRIAMTNYFWDNDPYRHLIVIHNGSNDDPDDLLGNVSDLTGFSLQTNQSDFRRVFGRVKEWVDRSRDAGKKWAVACDEPGNAQDAIRPDNDAADSHVDGRKNALWGTLLAGGWGNEWYFGYQHDHSDLSLQDFRSRDLWWDYNRYAIEFFDQVDLPLIEMLNDNSLLSNDNDYCYAKEGEAYVVYLKNGGTNTLDLTDYPGEYSIQWYDPRNGGQLVDGSVTSISGEGNRSLGTAPNSGNQDWVLYVVRTSDPLPNEAPTVNFTTPAGDLTVQEGYTSLELTAEALDSDGTIESVGLYIDDVFIRNENIAPYDFGQGNQVAETLGLTAGNYTFKVIATDNDGATAEDTFTLTVVATLDNEIPTVMFSDPSEDLTVQEGYTSLPLEASASDSDGTIASVGLFIDGQFIRIDTTAPYTWGSGTNQDETLDLTVGTYTIQVIATDDQGATAEDTFVLTVTALPNEAPTVEFTTPAGDLTVQEGYTSLELTAEALDSDGTIESVELYIDGVFVRSENLAPYDFGQGNNVAETLGLTVGSYTFTVIATDDEGATAEDTFTLTVTAVADNEIPTVMFSDPSEDLTVQEGYTSLPLEASASDADGTIASVGLYIDGQFIRNDFDAPYTWGSGANQDETLGLAPGIYTLRVLAIDDEGATAEDTILLTVVALPNEAPTVEFTNPTGDLTLEEGYISLPLTAQALDSDGTIESVGLYIDDVFVRNENVAPYDFGQGNNVAETLGLTPGSYTFTVIATDDEGATAEDTFTLTVTAVAENQVPTVMFSDPSEDLTVQEGYTSLPLEASASDADGTIANVGLYIDGQFIRNDFDAPYTWGSGANQNETLGLAPGVYTLRVLAIDDEGATAEDTILLTVTALPNEAPTVEFTNPTGDLTLEEGYVSLPLTAQALDSDGTIESVGLYIDGAFVRNENVAPYDFGQGNNVAETLGLTVGSYAFTVIATDGEGATAEDTFTLTVTAVAENQAPGVAFTTPFEETLTVEEGYDSLELVAEAFDDDGSIVSVGLYIDGVFIRNDFESQFNWGIGDNAGETLGLTAGTYTFTVIATDNDGATAEDTFILTVEGVLSAEGFEQEEIKISPNPANSSFFISGLLQPQGSVRVVDMLGRVVINSEIVSMNQAIDISTLSVATYMVIIESNEKIFLKKIIKI